MMLFSQLAPSRTLDFMDLYRSGPQVWLCSSTLALGSLQGKPNRTMIISGYNNPFNLASYEIGAGKIL